MAGRSRRLARGIRLPEWSPENETLDHFERFCWTLWIDEANERLRLREFQLDPLADYFAGGATPEFFMNLWEWPTGQGKSGILAALGIHHGTYCVPTPRVFVLGGENSHARNTIDAAAGFISASRKRGGILGQWWEAQEHAGGRVVPLWLDNPDAGIFARSAGRSTEQSGGSSVEGKNPTAIFVEELHRHADGGAAMNTLITKTIKSAAVGRAVRVLVVTTAGTDRNGALGRLEAQVLDEEGGAKVEKDRRPGEYYTRAVSADGDTVAHIYAVPESIGPPPHGVDGKELDEFLEHVKRANPADWITVRSLRRIWKSLTRAGRWMFLRQNANQWVTAGYAVIERSMWWRQGVKVKGLEIPSGKGIRVFIGLDRASKWDSTAIVPVWKDPEGKYRCAGAVILDSPRDGTRRRTSDVADILDTMRERWPDMVVVFDRNHGGGDVAEEFEEKYGLVIIDHSQGVPFDLASMRLAELVEKGDLQHDGNELLAQQVLAAVMKETAGGKRWRGEQPNDETQIDGFDALAMAVHMASQPFEEVSEIDPEDYHIEQL